MTTKSIKVASPSSDLQNPGALGGSIVLHWLDDLASGECTQDEFLQQVRTLEENDAEATFEALAVLDQYFRRRKISRDVFVVLKARLQHQSLGFGKDAGGKASALPRPAPAPSPASAPVMVAAPVPQAVPAIPAAPRILQVGDMIRGRYRITEIVCRDYSGTTVKAMDERRAGAGVGQRLAIHFPGGSGGSEPAAVLRRVCSLHELSHPGIVRVFDVDEERGELFLAMEWLHGVSLRQFLEQNGQARLSPAAAGTLVCVAASALAYAHSRDVFHGDVCAENIFITDVGEVRLRGFALAGKGLAANPQADRLAFAWLAYELLSGAHARQDGNAGRVERDALRRPPGVTREQWRVLRNTLVGKESQQNGNVLTAFADDSRMAASRITLLHAFSRTPVRSSGRFSGWVATGIVAAILATGGYLLVSQDASNASRADRVPLPVPAPVVQAAALEAAADTIAARVVAEIAATPPVVPEPQFTRARIDLPSSTLQVAGDQPAARIWVRRQGRMSGAVTFQWWTETGSAQVNRDFARITARTEVIADGARGTQLLVPLVTDPSRLQPRTFFVKIDAAGAGATLGEQTLMQVTILPPGWRERP